MLLALRTREGAGRRGASPVDVPVPERTSNLGLVTRNVQWLMLMGTSFVVAAYLQVGRGYDAIGTGVILLASSPAAGRLAKRRPQRTLAAPR